MQTIINPDRTEWESLLQRPVIELRELEGRVRPILHEVKEKGDAALFAFTERFDGVALEALKVSPAEREAATTQVSESLKSAIEVARQNIEAFHRSQKEELRKVETMPGVRCWRKSVPIQRVGLYIPGGTAPLFSTLLMLAVPAQIAGCEKIVLCTPPNKSGQVHPAILYTAELLGLTEIYKVGGAQAVAAMAYGTESVPKVDKIFGPGNQYVTLAKQIVSQEGTAIDMPAGPSEVAIVADESATPAFIAADLLSQAEHGSDSQVVLVTLSDALIPAVKQALQQQLDRLPRKTFAEAALQHSKIIRVNNREEATDIINVYAPEHLILAVEEVETFAEGIINAGSVFLGHFTPESVGDYASGTNHTLPTNGYARAYSGVSLDSFVKKITFQQLTKEGIQRLGPVVETMAEAEELEAHRYAVRVRLDSLIEK